ncbi:MAG TPA: response regulator [Terriglobia bacterium]|nr:response regulator [Terriglobia bacterium]
MQDFDSLVRRKDGLPLQYLIVDDSVFARRNLQRIISMFGGVMVGEAGDGRAAIEAYGRLLPDLVLMDVTMPDMEGIEAAENIINQHPDARIVMVSSVAYQENVSEALRKGALYFVQKPPKPEILYDVIKSVLGQDAVAASATKEKNDSHEN